MSDIEANQAYGALREGLHIVGYTFERACEHLEWLLVDDRWALGDQFADVNAFMDSIRLNQFRAVAEQRKRIALRIKELQPDVSNRQIARTLGVHHDTVNRDVGGNPPRPENNESGVNGLEEGSGGNPPEAAPYRTLGTGDNEWWTPVEYIERARRVLGEIDLDPASSALAQDRVKAARFYTTEDDGLAHEWHGRVFLNPPYAQPAIEQFIDKLIEELEAGRTTEAILLTHNSTDTHWFGRAQQAAPLICFTSGRIAFESPTRGLAAPVQGQAFFFFGCNVDGFRREFVDVGFMRLRDSLAARPDFVNLFRERDAATSPPAPAGAVVE